jgi:hypothetical protein
MRSPDASIGPGTIEDALKDIQVLIINTTQDLLDALLTAGDVTRCHCEASVDVKTQSDSLQRKDVEACHISARACINHYWRGELADADRQDIRLAGLCDLPEAQM